MNNVLISIAFDDGRGDNYEAFREILEPLQIPAVFHITTAYNDGSGNKSLMPTKLPPLGVDRIREMAKRPYVEIACHGREHICEIDDAREGCRILKEWLSLSEDCRLGYSCPNSAIREEALKGEEWSSFAYLRTGIRIQSLPALRILARKADRICHIPFLYRLAYRDCIMTSDEPGSGNPVLYSANVLKSMTVEEVVGLVKYAIHLAGKQQGRRTRTISNEPSLKETLSKGILTAEFLSTESGSAKTTSYGLIFLFHSILPCRGGEEPWVYDKEKFRELCLRLKEMEERGVIRLVTEKELCGKIYKK